MQQMETMVAKEGVHTWCSTVQIMEEIAIFRAVTRHASYVNGRLGPIHTGRRMRCSRKFEHFSFDVACMQCGHPHSYQQIPFACVAMRVTSRVLCGWGVALRKLACTDDAKTHQKGILDKCSLHVSWECWAFQSEQVRFFSVKAERPDHPSRYHARQRGVVVGVGGPPRQRRHVHDSIRPIRLTVELGLKTAFRPVWKRPGTIISVPFTQIRRRRFSLQVSHSSLAPLTF